MDRYSIILEKKHTPTILNPNMVEVKAMEVTPFEPYPDWLVEAVKDNKIRLADCVGTGYAKWVVKDLEGVIMFVKPGDWIVRGEKEDFYIMKQVRL
jgi:hypothetical protein